MIKEIRKVNSKEELRARLFCNDGCDCTLMYNIRIKKLYFKCSMECPLRLSSYLCCFNCRRKKCEDRMNNTPVLKLKYICFILQEKKRLKAQKII